MTDMKISKNVKQQIQAVEDFLKKRFGEVSPEWKLQISLLESNLAMKEKIDDAIEKEGILVPDRFDHMVKNPLLKTSLELQVSITRCIEQLGISPKANGHLKKLDDNDTTDLLNKLIND